MKVLVVGSGGREHALAWKMKQSPQVSQVYVAPGNDGMRAEFEVHSLTSQEEIIELVKNEGIELTFVGQEVYLVEGLVDAMEETGCRVVGPTSAAAALEGSKAFSKNFMKRHNIPTAEHSSFEDPERAIDYLESMDHGPYVIKTSGLAAGKGVLICETLSEARKVVQEVLSGEAFGDAGSTIVIEEFLKGEEASYFVLTDGKDFVSFPSCQDHKRVGELDTGLNTGGMGAYSPAPVVTDEVEQQIIETVVKPTIEGMAKERNPYKGILYIGVMIDKGVPKVVEYNCRFGDPECQALMMRLESDLVPLLEAVATESLGKEKPVWREEAATCVMLASGGYPEAYEKGAIISGLDAVTQESSEKSFVFHSGTKLDGSVYRTNGGRVLGVTALGKNLEESLKEAYQLVKKISWDGMHYRTDIGVKGLLHYRDNRPEKSVAIVIGSQSDLDIAKKATALLEKFNVGYRLCITSAHRTPERTRKFIEESEAMGVEVFIAMAGMAAHLPGVVAAESTRPVIGVPIVSTLDGMDSLLAIAQMPPGVPVATMATNGGANAAILAVQILSLAYTDLRAQLKLHKIEMAHKVIASQSHAGLEPLL